MTTAPLSTSTGVANHSGPQGAAIARCPHVVFRRVLGAAHVTGLLDYVAARRNDFRPSTIRNRQSGQKRVVDRLYLGNLGAFAGPIEQCVAAAARPALDAFHISEPHVVPREFALTAYGDGGYFAPHVDTQERLDRVRVLSCVYYFGATPQRFSGGELRLHGFPGRPAGNDAAVAPIVDVPPETDTLVIFPSWLQHEVLPVRVPSGAWHDGRFTITCWLHRATI